MIDWISFILAIIPLVVMAIMILKIKAPLHWSVIVSLVIVVVFSLWCWHTTVQFVAMSLIYGAVKGFWPIVIVILAAIFSYNVMLKTGGMETIKNSLASVSDDKRIQLLLIGWCFGGFLEAVAGYGTAVAIPVGILIALGFNPFKAALSCLIANTVPTAFGAVGIPISILAQNTGLDPMIVSKTVIMQLAIFNILLPFLMVMVGCGGIKAIKGVFWLTLVCGIVTLIPQYIIASKLGAELPAFGGSIVSIIVVIFLAKLRKKNKPTSTNNNTNSNKNTMSLGKACITYILIFIFIIACSPLFPSISSVMDQISTKIPFALGEDNTKYQVITWISTPGVLIFIATIIGGLIQGSNISTLIVTFCKTLAQLRKSIVAVMAIVAMSTLMDFSGMINVIALTLVTATGSGFIFVAPIIGAFGTFVTGSDTNSNVLFGKLQIAAAAKLNIDPYVLVSANGAGATGGKMVSPQTIAIAASSTKMNDKESAALMKESLKYCIGYVIVLCLKVAILYYIIY